MRTSNRFRLLGGIVLTIVLVQTASAAQDEAKKADDAALPAYEQLDANKDGIVTLPEVEVYSPALASRIRHCDANADGKLTRAEYAACKPKGSTAKEK